MNLEEKLNKALSDLGNSAEEVAATLVKNCVVGYPNTACRCPVANYLKAIGFYWPMANCTNVLVSKVDNKKSEDNIIVRTPKPVSDFIARFDHREFAECKQGE